MENKRFKPISDEDREIFTAELINRIKKICGRKEVSDGLYAYDVILQDHRFLTCMTDDELTRSAELTFEVLEELRNINNSGVTRERLAQLEDGVDRGEDHQVMGLIRIWNQITTEKLSNLIGEIDEVRRVGGAYALILPNPVLISAIYSVFKLIVDDFDNEKKYISCSFFLMRAIMKVNSDTVEAEKD